jgi:hypothetical protein
MNLKEKANAVVTRVDWPCIKYSTPYSPSQHRCVESLYDLAGQSAMTNIGDKQSCGCPVMKRAAGRFREPVSGGAELDLTGAGSLLAGRTIYVQ